jgi:hypothetical protein
MKPMDNLSTDTLPLSKTIVLGTFAWIAAGCAVLAYAIFAYAPASSTLGVANSAARIGLYSEFVLGVTLPVAIYGMYVISRIERFRAPPGRYVAGQKYSLFSPYNLAAMGVIAALYAAGSLFGSVTNFDIVAAVTAFAAVMFPPIIPLVAIIVGGFLRFAITGISFLSPAAVPAFIIMDASRWAIASWLIFYFVRSRKSGLGSLAVYVVLLPIILIQYSVMTITQYFILNPWSAFLGNVAYMGTWFPTTIISAVVGLLAAEAAYRSVSRRQRRSDQMMAAVSAKPAQPTQP